MLSLLWPICSAIRYRLGVVPNMARFPFWNCELTISNETRTMAAALKYLSPALYKERTYMDIHISKRAAETCPSMEYMSAQMTAPAIK